MRAAAPPKETREALEAEPLYEAERLRIIYQLITNPVSEGGAGITPKEGEWENIESLFALHDLAYNKDWIKKWTSSYFLKTEDLDDIRNRLGEKVCPAHPLKYVWLTTADCILLRLHPVLLHVPALPRGVRRGRMAASRTLLCRLRHCERSMVHSLHRVVEASGNRLGCALGRSRCLQNRAQETELPA